MSRIFRDTSLFIYLFEDYGKHSEPTAQLRRKMLVRGDDLLTSTLAIGELLTGPERKGEKQLCQEYEEAIRQAAVVVSFEAAQRYAQLRARPSGAKARCFSCLYGTAEAVPLQSVTKSRGETKNAGPRSTRLRLAQGRLFDSRLH